jgi:hypothetical protein
LVLPAAEPDQSEGDQREPLIGENETWHAAHVDSQIAWGRARGPLEASLLGSSDHACEAELRLAIAEVASQITAARIAMRQSQRRHRESRSGAR